MSDTNTIYEGMWDFAGSCAPPEDGSRGSVFPGQLTFTLGCFQWVRRSGSKKLKRGRVTYRVNGHVESPKVAYEAARAYCAKKNARLPDSAQ